MAPVEVPSATCLQLPPPGAGLLGRLSCGGGTNVPCAICHCQQSITAWQLVILNVMA